MRLLLVLRDPWLSRVADGLRARAESMECAATTSEAELAIAATRPEVVLFDDAVVSLEVLQDLRARHAPGQLLVGWLAVRASRDSARLLDLGCDEVLDAGMDGSEWCARLSRALHRGQPAQTLRLAVGELEVDAHAGTAQWQGNELALTPREREVLHVLAAAAGRVVRREVVYRHVWGWTMPRGDRTVDVNVKRLRAKLAAAGTTLQIHTQPGVGYRLEAAVTAL